MRIVIKTERDSTYTVTLHLTKNDKRHMRLLTGAGNALHTQSGGLRRRSHVIHAVTNMLRQYEKARG